MKRHRRAIAIKCTNKTHAKWTSYFSYKDNFMQFERILQWFIYWQHNLGNESHFKIVTFCIVSQNREYVSAHISRSLTYTLFFILFVFLLLQSCLLLHLMKGCTKLFLTKITLWYCTILWCLYKEFFFIIFLCQILFLL